MKPSPRSHLLARGEETVLARVHLQPVAAHDPVVHHEAQDERQLRLEDLVLVQVDALNGWRRRHRLPQLLRTLPRTVVLEVRRRDAFLYVSVRGRTNREQRTAGGHVCGELERQLHVLLLVLVVVVDGASLLQRHVQNAAACLPVLRLQTRRNAGQPVLLVCSDVEVRMFADIKVGVKESKKDRSRDMYGRKLCAFTHTL